MYTWYSSSVSIYLCNETNPFSSNGNSFSGPKCFGSLVGQDARIFQRRWNFLNNSEFGLNIHNGAPILNDIRILYSAVHGFQNLKKINGAGYIHNWWFLHPLWIFSFHLVLHQHLLYHEGFRATTNRSKFGPVIKLISLFKLICKLNQSIFHTGLATTYSTIQLQPYTSKSTLVLRSGSDHFHAPSLLLTIYSST